AEEDHRIFGERPVQLVLLAVGERLAEVDALDLRANDGRELVDGDGLVRRTVLREMPIAGAGVAAQRSLHELSPTPPSYWHGERLLGSRFKAQRTSPTA